MTNNAAPRRWLVFGTLALVVVVMIVIMQNREHSRHQRVAAPTGVTATDSLPAESTSSTTPTDESVIMLVTPTSPPTTTSTTLVAPAPDDGLTAAERTLVDSFTISDPDLRPKSVIVTDDGLFFLQNMMYRHNVSVFDRLGTKRAMIDDQVNLANFGIDGGVVQGSPVEAAVSPDGDTVYVSNYQMFGPGYDPSAGDNCNRGQWDDSFVYAIDTATLTIRDVIPTGPVPKHLAVSPDGQRLVVSNWCGFDVSIIDTATGTELGRVDVGRHPRGVAVESTSSTAYVAVMGGATIAIIDLDSLTVVGQVPNTGTTPRHLILSDDDRYLYVTNNSMNSVRKIDLSTGEVAGVVHTGTQTRSMDISDDGTALYVVNYEDGTISKVRTSDMVEIQELHSGHHPIGIAYDDYTHQVWVANYAGTIRVFTDQ